MYIYILSSILPLLVCLIVPSGPVTNLEPRHINATTVELSWGPVDEWSRQQNGIILSYNIYYRLYNTSDSYMMMSDVTERVSDVYQSV